MGTSGQQVERLEKAQRRLTQDWIEKAADALGVALTDIISASPSGDMRPINVDEDVEMVGIQHIDMEYGLGATFADGHVDVEVLKFPQVWVRTITHSPPELLTWTRGRGDSMSPTILDGDLVMLDRSQRVIREPDALWAFTVGETAAIKRLRLKGDRVQIFSDNTAVPPDEEPLSMVNIVGRVVFVGSRK